MTGEANAGHGMTDLAAALFEESPVGIARLDRGGGILICNAALATLLGQQEGSLIDRAFADVFAAEYRDEVRAQLAQLARGAARRITLANVRLGGADEGHEQRAVQVFASVVGGQNEPGELLVHVLDGSERDQGELQSAHDRKLQALGQVASGIAHDFNNLIGAILGSCEMALTEIRAGASGHDDLASVRATALRARDLVRQLLAFARKQPPRPVLLHLDRAIDDLLPLLRRLLGGATVVEVRHAAPLPLVRMVPGRFDQVIINLAVNAGDAMPRGGRLSLRTTAVSRTASAEPGTGVLPAGTYVQIEVADTGSGIAKEVIGEIFAPFFSTKPAGKGTGLGLATVSGIVRQSGGCVEVDSAEGVGATFRILLPAVEPAAISDLPAPSPMPPTEPACTPLPGARILLVEDEAAIRSFVARALRARRWVVAEVEDGASAIQALRRPDQTFDLLLTDLKLPDMPGTEVIRQARLDRPDIPVVVISGELGTGEAFNPGDRRLLLLNKPFTLTDLVAQVQRLLAG